MRKSLFLQLIFMFLAQIVFAYNKVLPEEEPLEFQEVWGYVIEGFEEELDIEKMHITDLCYFSASVNSYGEIDSVPDISKIKQFNVRNHLVVTCDGRALSHLAVNSKYGKTKDIIKVLAEASKEYDGIQIDMEYVPSRDCENFILFLKQLRKKIGKNKMLTVCVPARLKTLSNDVYDYKKISRFADRVFIMAYDQHWSTSSPGAVAEMEWSKQVALYGLENIPAEKLIVGMPFYGRTWVFENFGKAWFYSGICRILEENNVSQVEREDSIPHFKFQTQVEVTGYFDDAVSLVQRMKMFKSIGVDKIGFWRIGQEDPDVWDFIK